MAIKVMSCPACSHPLPEDTRPNELVSCPACGATLYLSDWEIGRNDDAVMVATPTRVYSVTDLLWRDDLCNVYRCHYKADDKDWQGMFRLARGSEDNDLVQNEAKTLYHLQTTKDYDDFRPFLPLAMESFLYKDSTLNAARHVNILGLDKRVGAPNEFYSLEEINRHYPNGLDPRDMAWIWRRLLYILGFVHGAKVVHGSITPAHVMIEPKEHKLLLTGWGFSVREPAKTQTRLTAISQTYEKWYPPEVFDKQIPTASLDLFMAARCMMYFIGADPLDEPQHRNLESQLAGYFARCVRPKPASRPQDAWKLLAEFDTLIEKLWGPRTFRVFTMPYKA